MERIGKVFLIPSIPREGTFGKFKYDNRSLADEESSDDEETFKDIPLLSLPSVLQTRLMDHQKIGVRWLHSLYLSGSGGILGDDMGLGKTFQVICLLAGLMQEQSIQRVLILAPVSVLPNWQKELVEHLQPHFRGCDIFMVNSDLTKKKRLQLLDATFQQSMRGYAPKVVLSSYQLVANMVDDFANRGKWDYVILDEGHIIKNPSTKTSKAMHELSARHRLILTGTPVQNNLNEFWAIANWATKGKRFGTLSGFKTDFTLPIVAGQNPRATEEERRAAEVAARNLLSLTKPILLQRKKCELPKNEVLQLPTKIELVVWAPLATAQRSLYEEFLHSRQFDMAVHRSTCPVEVINHLKTVCRHPLLIEALEANRRRREVVRTPGRQLLERSKSQQSQRSHRPPACKDNDEEEEVGGDVDIDALGEDLAGMKVADDAADDGDALLQNLPANATVYDVVGREPDVAELLRGSIKLRILLKLIHRLHFAGHRTLVFSQSRLMLDIIQRVLANYSFATHRIDGGVKSAERQRIIEDFNDTAESGGIGPTICLLTTKACGFGITLTGADRVIIYDPSWNPAEDRQAVDRAYRIGQTKPVVVYRLIMASSVEEKMYEKQVFKDGIRVVTESGTSSRYFSKDETKELFTLGPLDKCEVMERMWKAAGSELRTFPDTRGDLPSVLGFSRHDTLYTEVRPDSLSQGEDAYAQFADTEFVATDSEDEALGVPPTPHPHRRPPQQQNQQQAPVSTHRGVGAGKENSSSFLNQTPRAPSQSFASPVKGECSEPIDLLTPQPVRGRVSAVASGVSSQHSESIDLAQYAALQAAKLFSPTTPGSQPPVDSPACSHQHEHQASPSQPSSSPSPTAVSQEQHGTPGQWGDAAVSAYNELRGSKLFSPEGRWSMPDRVSMLTEPSMYGDECEVGTEECEVNTKESDVAGEECEAVDTEIAEEVQQDDGVVYGQECEAEDFYEHTAQEVANTPPARRKTLVLTDSEGKSSEMAEDLQTACSPASTQPSAAGTAVDMSLLEESPTQSPARSPLPPQRQSPLLAAEGWSDDEAELNEDVCCPSAQEVVEVEADSVDVATAVEVPEPAAALPPSPSQIIRTDVVEELSAPAASPSSPDRTLTSESAPPTPACHAEEGCWDEESACSSGFYGAHQPAVGAGMGVGVASRSGFLLNNLCEMGSMKRTASVLSEATSSAAPSLPAEGCASLSGGNEPAVDNSMHPISFMPDMFLSPTHPAAVEAPGNASPRTAGFTVRKRATRLSNYMEPDIFASPAWMAPGIFSPEAGGGRKQAVFSPAPESETTAGADVAAEQASGEVDDGLHELREQVRSLAIAAVPVAATPRSKISFQTAVGALSNMVVTARSVSKAPRVFADLSSSDSSESERGSDDESDGDESPCIQQSGDSKTLAKHYPKTSPEDPGTPIVSPKASTRRSGQVTSEAPPDCGGETPGTTVIEICRSQRSSWCPQSPKAALFDDEVPNCEDEAEVVVAPERTPVGSPDASQHSSASSCGGMLSSAAHAVAMSPVRSAGAETSTPVDSGDGSLHNIDNKAAASIRAIRVERPASALSAAARAQYNAHLQRASMAEGMGDLEAAAGGYCDALEVCDEDASLHGKLAWLLSVLERD